MTPRNSSAPTPTASVSNPATRGERLNPLDAHDHDLRVVLIDRSGRVRGYYSTFHPQSEIPELMQENLEADTPALRRL